MPFCQGLRNAVRIGWLPIAFTVETTAALNLESRIEDQEALRRLAVFPSLVQLQGNPKRVGITGHVAVQDPTPVVADYEEAVQNAEGQRRHSKKIHRRNGLAMVPQESQPAPGGIRRSRGSPNPSPD